MEQTIAADGAVWSASSCLFATTRTPAKMAELIEIWVEDLIGPRNRVLDGDADLPRVSATLGTCT